MKDRVIKVKLARGRASFDHGYQIAQIVGAVTVVAKGNDELRVNDFISEDNAKAIAANFRRYEVTVVPSK